MRDVVLLLARPRSGTNALQAALATNPDVFCTREVLHHWPRGMPHLDQERNFFRFLETYAGGCAPTRATFDAQAQLFADYVGFLRESAPQRVVVIDVKYNQAHLFDGPQRGLIAPPHLFKLAADQGMRVLHLERSNYLRGVVSVLKARRNRSWIDMGNGAARPADDPPIAVPAEGLLGRFAGIEAERDLVRNAFAAHEDYLQLEYADVFADLPATLTRLAGWLGVADDFRPDTITVRKQSARPLHDEIANFDEVAAALRGSRWAACLEDEVLQR